MNYMGQNRNTQDQNMRSSYGHGNSLNVPDRHGAGTQAFESEGSISAVDTVKMAPNHRHNGSVKSKEEM